MIIQPEVSLQTPAMRVKDVASSTYPLARNVAKWIAGYRCVDLHMHTCLQDTASP
jgi:hypothetical protein